MIPTDLTWYGRWARIAALMLCICTTGSWAQAPGYQRLGQQLLDGDTPSLRREAAEALGRASEETSVRLLSRALLTERNIQVRLAIIRGLREIVFQRYPGYRSAMVALGRAADDANERDELVRLRATEALWEAAKKDLLDPVPLLERQLTDQSERVRLSAVKMMRKHGSPEAAEALGRAILNKALTETVRLAAIDALGAVALSAPGVVGRDIVRANIAVSAHFGQSPLPSTRALELRHERQVAYLAALIRDTESTDALALRAVKSLGRVKDHSAIPVLQEVVTTHRSLTVRQQATRVLSHVLARQYE